MAFGFLLHQIHQPIKLFDTGFSIREHATMLCIFLFLRLLLYLKLMNHVFKRLGLLLEGSILTYDFCGGIALVVWVQDVQFLEGKRPKSGFHNFFS